MPLQLKVRQVPLTPTINDSSVQSVHKWQMIHDAQIWPLGWASKGHQVSFCSGRLAESAPTLVDWNVSRMVVNTHTIRGGSTLGVGGEPVSTGQQNWAQIPGSLACLVPPLCVTFLSSLKLSSSPAKLNHNTYCTRLLSRLRMKITHVLNRCELMVS